MLDAGAGTAAAIHALRGSLRGRVSATAYPPVPLTTQLLFLSQGMRAPCESDGCVEPLGGGATLRDTVATFVDACAADDGQARLQACARLLAQRRTGSVEPPAALTAE
uniref:Uncharacterized protein n=1 Tax=Neobodo designis TaxID=312471 RepID=A0A7S1Q430_NEODS